MCKKKLTELVDFSRLAAIKPEQRALVVEACLGYYILNDPPEELVAVVNAVSERLIERVASWKDNVMFVAKYVASKSGVYLGVLEEDTATESVGAMKQVMAALKHPSIAVQLNAHRTLVRFVVTLNAKSGFTGRSRQDISKVGQKTTRYGAVGLMGDVELDATMQLHVPGSSLYTTTGTPHPHDMPAVAGPSGSSDVLMKIVLGLGLSHSQQRWYCLGILGFLLAPGAHSLHEVAMSVSANAIAEYTPLYRYCGFLGFEMQKASWYTPMVLKFGSSIRFGYWGDLEVICYELVRRFPLMPKNLWRLVFTFLELPFLPALESFEWSGTLKKHNQKT
jgi:hypothetical protein